MRILLLALLGSLFSGPALAEVVLSGSASYPAKMTLPVDAVFEVQLQDVSLADAPAKVIARSTQISPGKSPLAFSLRFDNKPLNPKHSYALHARVSVDGKLVLITDTRYTVKADGSDAAQNLELVKVSEADVKATPLQDSYWRLVQLNGEQVISAKLPNEPHLLLSSAGRRASGSTGCNRILAGYALVGSGIHFTGLGSSRMACPDGGAAIEQTFLDALLKTKRWKLEANQLSLLDAQRKLLMVFRAGTPPKL